ncbi:MAG: hypothetical protein V1899_12365 [Planctomycetota bacterium]
MAYSSHDYDDWPDRSVPSLDGLTLRQAAQDPSGRKKLEAYLRDMEERIENDPENLNDGVIDRLRAQLSMPG